MDLTIEAIEQDLMNAEARAGQPIAAVYLKRAEIRAMLMGARYPGSNKMVTRDPDPIGEFPRQSLVVPEITVEDDEMDDDFFAEAKRERKK